MTPPNWDHVDHELTRKVLAGEVNSDEGFEAAIEFAVQCLQADQHNENVTHEMYSARFNAIEEAELSWFEHADHDEARKELRRFWSI